MASKSDKPNEELESLIRHEEVRMLYENMPFSTLAISISSITLFFALYNHVESTNLLTVWITVTLFWVVVRGWDTFRYSHADDSSQKNPVWGQRFLIGSSFAGLWWGLLSWLGHSDDGAYQALIVVAIIGVAGGALSTTISA